MVMVRRLLALWLLGVPLVLLTPHPVLNVGRQPSPGAASAQGEAEPARIELFLPPARIAPPSPVPSARRPAFPSPRLAPAPVANTDQGFTLLERMALPPHPAARRPPGLFTVSRVGRRLLYRKGYLGEVPVHLVVADLKDPEIGLGVIVARNGIGTTESFENMVHRARPAAALTGTFFGVHNGLPTGDLVVNGHAIYQGFVGTAVAFTGGNVVSFIPTRYKEKTAWHYFDGVMRSGPLLVRAGQIAVGPREEGFVSLSPSARRARTAVGITPGQKLLLLAVKEPISLWRLAKLMRELGAYHAVAMDGGSSTGLYFRGQMVARPARALTNALVIYAYRESYPQARNNFISPARPNRAPPPSSSPTLTLQVQPAPTEDAREIPTAVNPLLPAEPASSAPTPPAPAAPPGSDPAPSAAEPARPAGAEMPAALPVK